MGNPGDSRISGLRIVANQDRGASATVLFCYGPVDAHANAFTSGLLNSAV
jgi:hypothetical protein